MTYISNTKKQQQEMLEAIGVKTIDDLFKVIPADFKPKSFNIPAGKSEIQVRQHLKSLASKNATDLICFLGGGFYDHYVPSAVDAIISRSEFYTAYTPYQPEVSQGVLQAIYEYQTAICRLTGMDISNASIYEGGTALYEAAMMATRITKRKKIIVCEGVSLIYRTMLRSYTSNLALKLVEISTADGIACREKIFKEIDSDTAAIILQNPNFFGSVDDFSDISQKAHSAGALTICSVYPISLGLLKPPSEMGIDIVTGEGQSLGLPLSFGGPYFGFLATLKTHVRQMPGRVVGRTKDKQGRQGFVFTLQTREQHIRREKATSNICTNSTLNTIAATVYLSLLGKQGFKETAQLCADKAEYACNKLLRIKDVKKKFSAPFFNEFVIELPMDAADAVSALIEKGFAAGFPLGRYYKGMEHCMLVSVTEKRTKEEIGHLKESLESVLKSE
ncbi:MAG: glycine dehydrogenase (aminomethyl-transferring) [Elusimicrobia bacterium RIFOXYA2_FULL_39_19]|nr:MAG: glycine dehydrogenase (aminomethyl-transferring) [Elusimicrobia bacterium RIFOXYA2_FULL_39_19]